MSALAYYNENDPKAAAWLRELIARGLIAPGYVDERDIRDVRPDDLRPYTRCHFFAGIGGWDYALALAGWPEDEPVWTGSCPCQPFSAAGRRSGAEDARHLWPEWWRLIADCQPPVIFGEQVASRDGRLWLAAVRADLETLGYAVGAADLCAAGVGAPHIRQRLWYVADTVRAGRPEGGAVAGDGSTACDGSNGTVGHTDGAGRATREFQPGAAGSGECVEQSSSFGRLALPGVTECGSGWAGRDGEVGGGSHVELAGSSDDVAAGLGHASSEGLEGRGVSGSGRPGQRSAWSPSDVVWCRDGKWRPVEPGTFPLAHGVPARVGRLRGYGNAIVPQVAARFIRAYRGVTA